MLFFLHDNMRIDTRHTTLSRFSFILWIALSTCLIAQVPVAPVAPITRVEEIRKLSRAEAAQSLPVKFSGVTLWAGLGAIVVDDGEQSIWVPIKHNNTQKEHDFSHLAIAPGNHVMIEGHTDPGGFAPVVVPQSIRQLGHLPIRQPKRVSIDQLLSGREDGQLLEVEGVIQEFLPSSLGHDSYMLSMVIAGHFCRVYVTQGQGLEPSELVDAHVRVKGILAPDHNARAQVLNLKLLTNSADDFEILTRPPPDPFAAPRVALDCLALFSPNAESWHRKVTSGVIIFAVPGQYFFLQAGDASIRVSSSAADLQAGQHVDVAGFVDRFDSIASLKNAVVRPLGTKELPTPMRVTSDMILDPKGYNRRSHATFDPACKMVSISGLIQKIDWDNPGMPRAVWVMSDERLFPAYLPLKQTLNKEQLRTWVPGAQVKLTGICELKFSGVDLLKRSYTPHAFHLLMPSPAALEIRQLPPWWNQQRMKFALACIGFLSLLLFSWAWLLRKQVARQSRIIGDKIADEAVHAERTRIARDLHDSLEQQLASVSLHLYGAKSAIQSNPESAVSTLDLARRMLKHTQRETRNSIRNLRSPLLENRSLVDALHLLAKESSSSSGPVIDVIVKNESKHLSADIEYQLLRLSQEAIGNAIKHASAQHIEVVLDASTERLTLTITDDGTGFVPDSSQAPTPLHFGMLSMRERAAKIGGTWKIHSAPGEGTTIQITLPLPLS